MSSFWGTKHNGDHGDSYVNSAITVCNIWVVLTLQYSQERGESEAGGEVDGEDETEHGEGGD